MLIRTADSTQHDQMLESGPYSDAVGIAAIWIGFYIFLGVWTMVGHGASAVAVLQ